MGSFVAPRTWIEPRSQPLDCVCALNWMALFFWEILPADLH
jgi:hypothetical protein